MTASEALRRLEEGNRRFVESIGADAMVTTARRVGPTATQRPFAIVLGCSDSRVPAEIVFDQGLGDLFVIRVAGNIVAPSQVGSVEFGAAWFGIRLVVVLGHSRCGAIMATLDALRDPSGSHSRYQLAIVDRVRPAIEHLVPAGGPDPDDARLVQACVRSNIRASVAQLQSGSELIETLVRDEELLVVGAEYSVETGSVSFL